MKPFCEQLDQFTVTSAYNSHRPFLKIALQNVSRGTIIELGMGEGSTPIFSEAAKEQERKFISYENNPDWYKKMAYLHSPYNSLKFVTDWNKVILEPCHILFIDHAPGERRKVDIERFKGVAEIIIVHDTETEAEYVYGMTEILSRFKYRIDLQQKGMPRTTIVSDKIDVTTWI